MRLRSKAAVAGLTLAALVTTAQVSTATSHTRPKPTIVLVHGAWADGSSWSAVTTKLQKHGYTVDVVPNPLRGVKSDSDYVARYLTTIKGPVVLAAHSYGGFVISNAAVGNPNVKALVYVDAYIPAQGDSLLSLTALNPGSQVGDAAINPVPLDDKGTVVDTYIKADLFPGIFANDLSRATGARLASTQRPLTASALGEESPTAGAWRTIPSWDLIGTVDHVIPPATQTFMANRAGAKITTVKASHLSMISQPSAVEHVIIEAADHA